MLGFVRITGKSGRVYQFQEYPAWEEFSHISTVYLFIRRDEVGNQPLFVGTAADMSVGFKKHYRYQCLKKQGATHVLVLQVDEESERGSIQLDILGAMEMVCNG